MAARIEIRLLGEPAILLEGRPVALRTARITAMLGYLATCARRSVSRATLAEALWPGQEPERAGQNLRQTLSRLRQSLGALADSVISAERSEIRVRPGGLPTDVAAFQAAIGANTAEGFREALALYTGPFLDGFEDEWAVPVRANLARGQIQALLTLADLVRDHDPEASLRLAERAIALEPYHEGARAREIRALRAVGEEALALRAFEAYETLLADDLGLRPARTVEEALHGERVGPPRPRPEPHDDGQGQAIRTFIDLGRPEEALRLAISMVPFWLETGAYRSGLRWLEATQAAAEAAPNLRSRAALSVAALAVWAAEGDRAYRAGKAAFEEADDDETRAEALLKMGFACLTHRKVREARSLAIRALRLVRRLPRPVPSLREAWILIAYAHDYDGRVERALRSARQALATPKGTARSRGMAGLLVAFAHLHLGDAQQARAALEEALTVLGDARSHANEFVRMTAARLMEEIGDVDRAEAGYLGAIETYRRSGDPWSLPIALTYLGDLRTERGDPFAALALHHEALSIREGTDDRMGAATSLRGLGVAHLRLGQAREAREALRESVRRYGEVESLSGAASSLVPLVRAEMDVGSRTVARRVAVRARRLLRDLGPAVCATLGPYGSRLLPEAESLLRELGFPGRCEEDPASSDRD